MARPSNKIDTVSMTVAFPPQIKRYLEDLSLKGTFGGVNPQDVVKHLVQASIQELIAKNQLKERKWLAVGDGTIVEE